MKIIRLGLLTAVFGLFFAIIFVNNAIALDIPVAPTLEMPILDQTNTLTNDQKNALAEQINNERQQSSNEIAILIINSLEDESIDDYSISVARRWGIGTNYNDNGVLLLIALNDKKLKIEVGTGLEGALTDIQTNRIIRNEITPAFKDGRYYDGINIGLASIIKAIHGEYTNSSKNAWEENLLDYLPDFIFLFIFIIFSWLSSILGRTKSWWLGGVIGFILGLIILITSGFGLIGIISILVLTPIGLLFDKIVSSNYKKRTKSGHKPSWWAGGSFGGFSGGSSSGGSFGGGGFSGGGSSGSW